MKDDEFYIEERDTTKAKADKSLVGNLFYVAQYIYRVGYMFEPPMMDFLEVDKEARNMLIDTFSAYLDGNRTKATHLVQRMTEKGYPIPHYKAQGRLAARKRREHGEVAEWRRFWFRRLENDFPYRGHLLVRITGVKQFWTGKWYPGGGNYEDYEPGGLSPAYHHTVYQCKFYSLYNTGWFHDSHLDQYYIHPLDLIHGEVEEKVYEI